MEESGVFLEVPAIVQIRENASKIIREMPFLFSGDFIWSDGNFACDCNRALFFARACGEDDPYQECGMCSYSVRIVAVDDGRELYADEDWDTDGEGGSAPPTPHQR